MNWLAKLIGVDRIERILKTMEANMSEQEKELNTALAALGEKIDALKSAVDALIAAIPADVDLTDEIAAVQAAAAEIGDITTEATEAT